MYCLQKWKRLHSRSRLEDLRDSLKAIGRADILEELDNTLLSFNKLVKKQVSTIGKKEVPKNVFINEEEELKLELKKQEAEILHQKLANFFQRQKNNQLEDKIKFLFCGKTKS